MKNYYEILEISPNASQEVIEKAYKALAKKYHPDSWPKDKAFYASSMFNEISEAYSVLSNVNLRNDYDRKLNQAYVSQNNEKINDLYYENEKLKQEINNIKVNSNSKKINKHKLFPQVFTKEDASIIKTIPKMFKQLIADQKLKPKDERSRDLKALIITLIIVAILFVVAFQVPAIKDFLNPIK